MERESSEADAERESRGSPDHSVASAPNFREASGIIRKIIVQLNRRASHDVQSGRTRSWWEADVKTPTVYRYAGDLWHVKGRVVLAETQTAMEV